MRARSRTGARAYDGSSRDGSVDGTCVCSRSTGRVGSNGGSNAVAGNADGRHPGTSGLSTGTGDFDLGGRLAGMAGDGCDDESRGNSGSDIVGGLTDASLGDGVSGQPLACLAGRRQNGLVYSRVHRFLHRVKGSVHRRVCRVYRRHRVVQ